MAPLPGRVTVVARDANGDGIPESSQSRVDRTDLVAGGPLAGELRNPGYPFWIGGIEHTVGQRPPTPPLDMFAPAGGWDGGLPRHSIDGYLAGGASLDTQTRLDFSKLIELARPVYFPETGTDVERAAMAFHAERCHDTAFPDGSAAACDTSPAGLNDSGKSTRGGFITNGAPTVAGAPYQEPCIDDEGDLLSTGLTGDFFDAQDGLGIQGASQFTADAPRLYKAAVIQTDVTFNKVGYHYPQQRIITLWEDVAPTLTKVRPPEPFVIRMNTFDCTNFLHTNLVPKEYELDDYQVKTPTDIIGQHIHLPKWDLTTADGAANGWNYEDGTLSPGMVVERIEAINAFNAANAPVLTAVEGNPVVNSAGETVGAELHPLAHPFFGTAGPIDPATGESMWLGARTTIQRWFADPMVNAHGMDRGLGVIFTHDHYGPSTHQQIGLYATVLTEPAASTWVHNKTGDLLYDPGARADGGPTSWQAAILTGDDDGDGKNDSFREFYFEFSDSQHAYELGTFAGVAEGSDRTGQPFVVLPPGPRTFLNSINPSFRQEANPVFPDVGLHPPFCPGGVPRPCPEAISADDVGMLVVNYRNEPIGLREFDVTAVLANDVLGNAVGAVIPGNNRADSNGDGIGDNEGGRLDPNGGTLVYNPRPTEIARIEVVDEETGEVSIIGGNDGPLHDPTAMMYVYTSDLQPAPRNFVERLICRFGGVNALQCPVELKASAPVEPIVLRAAAGDCIRVTLRNRLPQVAPDLAGFNTLLQVVNRDRDPVNGLTCFHNNLIRPSSHVGLHPQLVEYDVSRSDGANVGINRGGLLDPFQTLAPGNPIPERYTWYAGDIEYVPTGPTSFAIEATPVEFGASNLLPADRVKQGQKGLVGSLIIEPQGPTWAETDVKRDHQVNDPAATRRTRTMATVVTPDGGQFRDLVTSFRKGQNHRFGDGTAVQNIAGESGAVPEDSHDAGQQSIDYATEPMWYRFGLPPATPFGNAQAGLGAVANPELAYSNQLIGGDPVTPVFTAAAGQQVRMRVLMPTGAGRGTTFNLHGHLWQRDPYVCPGSADLGLAGKCTPDEVGSRAIGENPIGWYLGGQESVIPAAHFDIVVPSAGGQGKVAGDFLFRDHASFGNTSGLWGILRVTP